MALNKTGGGVGTNQYQIKGVARQSGLVVPESTHPTAQEQDEYDQRRQYDTQQIRRIEDVRLLSQVARSVLQDYPTARYVLYVNMTKAWRFEGILDVDGNGLAHASAELPDEVRIGIHQVASTLADRAEAPLCAGVTLDLTTANSLRTGEPIMTAISEFAVEDPDTRAERLTQLLVHPYPTVRNAVLRHPNCPPHIKAIATLGR